MSVGSHAISARTRYPTIDALRGVAVILMVVFHICYDLNYFAWINLPLYTDPFWLQARTLIVTLFVSIAGISLYLANHQSLSAKFWRRELILLGCASLISFVSWLLFGETWIFFGVLHFMVVASLLVLPTVQWSHWNLVFGIGAMVLGNTLELAWFDAKPWQWIGLMTHKPYTEDYVPLLPWLGVLWVGVWLGQFGQMYWALPLPQLLQRWSLLTVLGQHSLLIYMLHQPLLFGLFYALQWAG